MKTFLSDRLCYMRVSGELLLDIIKKQSDLPKDTSLVTLRKAEPRLLVGGQGNEIEFIIRSSEFSEQGEGAMIPEIMPTLKVKKVE